MSTTRVYIGGLTNDCRESDLKKFLDGYGKIRDISLKNGFGFVDFHDCRDADDAVYELNGRSLLGERVCLEHARAPKRSDNRDRFDSRPKSKWIDKYGPPTRTENRLIVENLSSSVSWQDLKDFMRQAGNVTYADAHKGKQNEGVVEFATYSDMKNAKIKLDNCELNGRKIRLVVERSHQNSRSYSRSRSRSRSRSCSPRRRRKSTVSRSRSASRSPPLRHTKNYRSRSLNRNARSRSTGGEN